MCERREMPDVPCEHITSVAVAQTIDEWWTCSLDVFIFENICKKFAFSQFETFRNSKRFLFSLLGNCPQFYFFPRNNNSKH
jgi:hypothetical protein